jgi:hypothetical protein
MKTRRKKEKAIEEIKVRLRERDEDKLRAEKKKGRNKMILSSYPVQLATSVEGRTRCVQSCMDLYRTETHGPTDTLMRYGMACPHRVVPRCVVRGTEKNVFCM